MDDPGSDIGWEFLVNPYRDPVKEQLAAAIEALRQAMFVITEQARTINRLSQPTIIHEKRCEEDQ